MNTHSFFKFFLFIFTAASLVSCDNDFNEMGANIVGNDNFLLEGDTYEVTAYTQPIGAVQTSALGVQQFGIYDDPVFGTTTAHTVVQVTLATINPEFKFSPEVQSVEMAIPYFSHVTQTNATDVPDTYALDSIWGPETGKLDLQIYQSDVYLRPDLENDVLTNGGLEKYYSNQLADFTTVGPMLNNALDVKQNTAFVFDNAGSIETTTDGLGNQVKVGPKMKIQLDKTAFQNMMFGPQAAGKFVNNSIFTNYFRGLQFKLGRSGAADPRFAMLNFAGGTITVKYKQKLEDEPDAEVQDKTLVFKLGKSVNLFEYQYSPEYQNVLDATPNQADGDEKLYIKGGAGSMAVIELFKNVDEINALRATKGKWLINDASLNFFVEENTNALLGNNAPKRLYLYDLNNKKVLLDYTIDQTQSTSNKYNKSSFGGIIDRVSSQLGTLYRIRITNHIRTLIAQTLDEGETAKTVRLGLVVTENINTTSNKSLFVPKDLIDNDIFGPTEEQKIDVVPAMSAAHPFGTVLYGTNISPGSANYDKRLRLTIHFTKPN
ncbi:DUF4270 domain-containing protein [Flavobacterium sp.]|uniref:DUF4270 domain-containing protein n=1 Tax=Flavobacterium sp. TaxID=239 RepID=UPI0039E2E23B